MEMRKTCAALAAVLAISAAAPPVSGFNAEAAGKPSISPKRISIDVGKSAKLTVKHYKKKVTWKTNKPKIIKLSAKKKTSVKITGRKKGSAKVTASYKQDFRIKKSVCKVTVKGNTAQPAPIPKQTANTTAESVPSPTNSPAANPDTTPTNSPGGQDDMDYKQKFRVVISTDFPPLDTRYPFLDGTPNDHKSDPDDLQSMVRFLLYANEFDIEALIASAATNAGIANKQNIIDMLDIYDQVYYKLQEFDPAYPTAEELSRITYQGNNQTWGQSVEHNIGEGMDTEASDAIIEIVDKEDDRPVWFCVWGDCSNIAQAVYRVKETRSPEETEKFISKMRIYQIAHQDDTIDWLMDNFPDLFIIFANQTYMGIFGSDNLEWVKQNIINNHGPLGAAYPEAGMGSSGVCEGDTPSFLYLLSAAFGISDAEDPTAPSWGGQFRQISGTKHYVDDIGPSTISIHANDFQSSFEERLELIKEQ